MAISSKMGLKIVWDNAINSQTRQWKIKDFFAQHMNITIKYKTGTVLFTLSGYIR